MKRVSILTLAMASVLYAFSQNFQLVQDINALDNSDPRYLIESNGLLYFSAIQSGSASVLFRSDGESGGTYPVYQGPPSNGPYNVSGLYAHNGKIYFTATDVNGDWELWVSDGSSSGTGLLKNINPNGSSFPSVFYTFGNTLLFAADDGNNHALWKTDGTSLGTVKIMDVFPYNFIEYAGSVYFSGNDNIHGTELWKTDGTTQGTQIVKDIFPGGGGSSPVNFTVYNGKLYFSATDKEDSITGYSNNELWSTDGTGAGTALVSEIWPDINKGSWPGNLTVYNSKLYFMAFDGTSYNLYQYDGMPNGVHLVKELNPSFGNSTFMAHKDGKFYFVTYDTTNQLALYSSDGTGPGTVVIRNFANANSDDVAVYNGDLYFIAERELWRSDGTTGGTYITKPALAPNSEPLLNSWLRVSNGALYFAANFDISGNELWKLTTPTDINDVKQSIVPSIYPNPSNSFISVSIPGNEPFKIIIYDVVRREVLATDLSPVSVMHLARGTYYYRIITQGNEFGGKVLIK